jgi:hypothetical protein
LHWMRVLEELHKFFKFNICRCCYNTLNIKKYINHKKTFIILSHLKNPDLKWITANRTRESTSQGGKAEEQCWLNVYYQHRWHGSRTALVDYEPTGILSWCRCEFTRVARTTKLPDLHKELWILRQ